MGEKNSSYESTKQTSKIAENRILKKQNTNLFNESSTIYFGLRNIWTSLSYAEDKPA